MSKLINNLAIGIGCLIPITIIIIVPTLLYFFHADPVQLLNQPTPKPNGFGAGFADGIMVLYNILKGIFSNSFQVFDAHSNGWYNFGFVSGFSILTYLSSIILAFFLPNEKKDK